MVADAALPGIHRRSLVVVDANAYWTEQTFRACADEYDVLLVKPREIRAFIRQNGGRWRHPVARPVARNVWELPLAMPPRFTTLLWPLGRRLLLKAIKAVHNRRPDVLVICFPEYLELANLLSPQLLIYYNYDDYGANWPTRAKQIALMESAAVSRSDLTICIARHRAEALADNTPVARDRVLHLPIGVTPKFMADALSEAPVPASLAHITRPIVGYVGALNYRFDFPFFAEVAALRPDISFVLGGRIPTSKQGPTDWWRGVQDACRLGNVHFIGWIPHEDLGAHLKAFDILAMFYSHCPFNTSACPAKLWDYLGIGSPIIATSANPETLLWSDLIRIANSPTEFAQEVDSAFCEKRSRAHERIAIAREHTWDDLAAKLKRRLKVLQADHS